MPSYTDYSGTTGDFLVGGKLSTTGGVLPRVVTLTDAATVTPNADTTDIGILTSLSQTTVFANPTGTPTNGQLLQIRITSSASRAISFGTAYQASSSLILPSATTGSNAEDYIAFRYNSIDSKWDLVGTTIGAIAGASTALDSISNTQGTVLFRGAASWQGLAPSTAGYALTTGGSGADPSYAQIPVISSGSVRFTPATSQTGIIPCEQFAAPSSNFTLANSTSAQNVFPSGIATITLSASTTYKMRGCFIIYTGTTTHTTALGFALGGGMSITNLEDIVTLFASGANAITTVQSTTEIAGTASKVLNATSPSATTIITFEGILRVNAGGTFTPQIAFSADPTGTCETRVGSWLSFSPIGTNTFQSVGNWS